MRTCDPTIMLLSTALDRPLTAAEQAEVDAHLAGCPDCLALQGDLTRLRDAMPLLLDEPPEGFLNGVMTRIRAETPDDSVTPIAPLRTRPRWRVWGGVAAAAVALAVGLHTLPLFWPDGSGPSLPPSPASLEQERVSRSDAVGEGAMPFAAQNDTVGAPTHAPEANTYLSGGAPGSDLAVTLPLESPGAGLRLTLAALLAGREQDVTYSFTGGDEQPSCAVRFLTDGAADDLWLLTYEGLSPDGGRYLYAWRAAQDDAAITHYAVAIEDGALTRQSDFSDADAFLAAPED